MLSLLVVMILQPHAQAACPAADQLGTRCALPPFSGQCSRDLLRDYEVDQYDRPTGYFDCFISELSRARTSDELGWYAERVLRGGLTEAQVTAVEQTLSSKLDPTNPYHLGLFARFITWRTKAGRMTHCQAAEQADKVLVACARFLDDPRFSVGSLLATRSNQMHQCMTMECRQEGREPDCAVTYERFACEEQRWSRSRSAQTSFMDCSHIDGVIEWESP